MLRTVLKYNYHLIARRLFRKNLSHVVQLKVTLRNNYLQWNYNDQNCLLIKKHFPLMITNRNYVDLPSHRIVKFPALSPTMEIGKIVNWLKKEGDKISEGDLIVEIETDKATLGMESAEDGYLAKIILKAGISAPVGAPLCVLVDNESDVNYFNDYKSDETHLASSATAVTPSSPADSAITTDKPAAADTVITDPSALLAGVLPAVKHKTPSDSSGSDERVLASPMAKRLAEERKIRLEGKGTGLFGSLTSKDLDKLFGLPSPGKQQVTPLQLPTKTPLSVPGKQPLIAPSVTYVDIPVTGTRKIIAQRLLQSKTTIPHYYLTITCNVDKLLRMRSTYNEQQKDQNAVKISVNDFMIKGCAYACTKVPQVNSIWMEKSIRQFKNVDVSVAVATPNGLLTPIIYDAHIKGLIDINVEMRELANRAKKGKLKPEEYQGGTITVTNLGMYGIAEFSAIINPPQCSILAIGTISKRVVVSENSNFREANFITVTLSSDHRVADGAVGAQWLQYFRNAIEDPTSMIL